MSGHFATMDDFSSAFEYRSLESGLLAMPTDWKYYFRSTNIHHWKIQFTNQFFLLTRLHQMFNITKKFRYLIFLSIERPVPTTRSCVSSYLHHSKENTFCILKMRINIFNANGNRANWYQKHHPINTFADYLFIFRCALII